MYDICDNYKLVHKFALHRSAVTCINFDNEGIQMFSGSQDTYIIVYDLLADQALFKLMGHRDHVTQIDPVQSGSRKLLLSSGKDGFLKVWDLRE